MPIGSKDTDVKANSADTRVLNNKRIVAPSVESAFDTIMGAYNDLPANGGTIEYVETIQETDIVFEKPIRLLGQGSERSATIGAYIDCSGGDGIHINSKAVVLRDVHVEGDVSSSYGARIGESDTFIENVTLENVSARHCVDGFLFGGHTQSVKLNILAGGNANGVHVDGVGGTDNDWFNSTEGRVVTQGNDTHGLHIEGGIHFDGNDWTFVGENPGSEWDMNVESTVNFSGNHFTGYGWHDSGLRCVAGGQGNLLKGRILRGGKELDFGGEFVVGYDEVGDGKRFVSDTSKVGCKVELSADQAIAADTRTTVEFDTADYDHWDTFDTTTHIYTIPEDGVWTVSAKARFSFGDASIGDELILRLSESPGGNSFCVTRSAMAAETTSVQSTKTEEFSAGDTVVAEAVQKTGGERTISRFGSDSHFEVIRIG